MSNLILPHVDTRIFQHRLLKNSLVWCILLTRLLNTTGNLLPSPVFYNFFLLFDIFIRVYTEFL